MIKYYKNNNLSPIVWQMKRNKLTTVNCCTILGITSKTLRAWIKDPGIIQLKNLIILAGLFGIHVEELIYIIIRNKPQAIGHKNKFGSWYLENIKESNK